MRIRGYAFQEDEKERAEMFRKRYEEISKMRDQITLHCQPGYAHFTFEGTLNTKEAQKLSHLDICLIADDGNLCFGGSCDIFNGTKFKGRINTD